MKNKSIRRARYRQSFFKNLLWSHMAIALIGCFSLLIGIWTIFIQTQSAQNLSKVLIPVSQASLAVQYGIQHSLASMRGFVSLDEEEFVDNWNSVWENTIDPALFSLRQGVLDHSLMVFSKNIKELTLLLAELKESQWWVLEIAQTIGNEPAKLRYTYELEPIFTNLEEIVLQLHHIPWGDDSFSWKTESGENHEVEIQFFKIQETLSKIILQGELSLEEEYRRNLESLRAIGMSQKRTIETNDNVATLIASFENYRKALELLSHEIINIRKSKQWNMARHLMATETVPLARKSMKIMDRITTELNTKMINQANLITERGKIAVFSVSILLFAMIIAAFIFSQKRAQALSAPVLALATAAGKIANGSQREDLPSHGDDELGDLTRSFNTMRNELDISQKKLIRQEKLAAIGQFSGSVAHDIRNPLGAISNSIYYLKAVTSEKTDEKITKHVAIMERETNRVNEIISGLMDFSRENAPSFSQGDLNDLINQIVDKQNLPDNILIKTTLDSTLPLFAFDHNQMRRIIDNLVTNAIQAMPEGGHIQLLTRVSELNVKIVVRDEGVGITEKNIEKIFEPLFSTKAKGVGFGLSIIKTFVEKHRGTIHVSSGSGTGTIFTVALPLDREDSTDFS